MTTEHAFRQRIATLAAAGNRSDWNTARCVFADWLEDQGRGRAESLTGERPVLRLGMASQWREAARRVLINGLDDAVVLGIRDPKELRKFLNERYPFGPRQYHPYAVWRVELRSALAGWPVKSRRNKARADVEDARVGLFGEGT